MILKRAGGLLLHITSLPSKYGIGDLGPEAYRFADFLTQAGQAYWQMLPLNPPANSKSFSPYDCTSAFAGNTLFISPELLRRKGLLAAESRSPQRFSAHRVDYPKVIAHKTQLFDIAYERFRTRRAPRDYERFCTENKGWLDDFALFAAIRDRHAGRQWCDWPVELRDKRKSAVRAAREALRDSIDREKFLQYVFFIQWFALKRYCNRLGVELIGDVPIYVAYDSADVWANREIFKLTADGRPHFISGVPPDLFSRTGQLWANPIYNWRLLRRMDYSWWFDRIRHNLRLFDVVRIDHFRGFFGFWQVPAGSRTAVNGRWVKGPGPHFFERLARRIPSLPIIVEDLGHITSDVKAFVDKSGLPGMRVLLFAFDGDPRKNPHLPHNHVANAVVYTGTHDTNTVVGWLEDEASHKQMSRLWDYLGRRPDLKHANRELIRLALSSSACLAIIPVQDVLGLGAQARMNRPARARGNWQWRLKPNQLRGKIAGQLLHLAKTFGRC